MTGDNLAAVPGEVQAEMEAGGGWRGTQGISVFMAQHGREKKLLKSRIFRAEVLFFSCSWSGSTPRNVRLALGSLTAGCPAQIGRKETLQRG